MSITFSCLLIRNEWIWASWFLRSKYRIEISSDLSLVFPSWTYMRIRSTTQSLCVSTTNTRRAPVARHHYTSQCSLRSWMEKCFRLLHCDTWWVHVSPTMQWWSVKFDSLRNQRQSDFFNGSFASALEFRNCTWNELRLLFPCGLIVMSSNKPNSLPNVTNLLLMCWRDPHCHLL